MLNVSLALSVLSGFASPAQEAASIAGVEPSVAPAERTRVLVLGTPHLRSLAGFRPEMLEPLLERLEGFDPDRVCVESLAPASIEAMRDAPPYASVVESFAGDAVRLGGEAQARLGASSWDARERLRAVMEAWDGPGAGGVAERIELLLASHDVPSAALHLAHALDTGESVDGVPAAVREHLARALGSSDETYALGVELARRLGLARVDGIDDHRDKDAFLRIAEALQRELDESGALREAREAAVYADWAERQRAAVETGDLLGLYLHANSAAYARADVAAQWDVFLRTGLPSGVDRERLALWEVRNLDIASHVRRVSSEVPGGAVLVVIGAAHKPFLDAYLARMMDVRVVQLAELADLGPGIEAAEAAEVAAASARPPRPPLYEDEWYLDLDDGAHRLFVREYGHGDPVVVLHGGWGAEQGYLVDMIWPHLHARRFVLYDQRGSLRSPAPLETISVERHVADLELLRRELELEQMTLVAHSMGTYLAMAYLRAHPDRVGPLVLVGAIPPRSASLGELVDSDSLVSRPSVQATLEAEGLTGPDLSARDRTHAWRVQFAAVNLFHVDRWRELRGGQVFYAAEAGSRAAGSMPDAWDFTDALRGHDWPLAVLVGDHDYVDFGAARWREFAREHPALELHVLSEAGHVAWVDRPRAFADALAEALGMP